MKEAMALVKDELGRDAVILHTKKYKKGGFLGYKSKEMFEVTAAVEDEVKRAPVLPKVPLPPASTPLAETAAMGNTQPAPALVPKNILSQYKTAGTEEAIDQVELSGKATGNVVAKDSVPPRIIKADDKVMQNFDPFEEEEIPAMVSSDEDKIQRLEQELAQMKELLEHVVSKESQDTDIVPMQEAMRQQEVDDDILQDMVHKIAAGDVFADKDSVEAQKALSQYLAKAFKLSGGIRLRRGKPKIVALIGTTGVGKTTTLAKIAARFVLEQGVSAALITADTYRISAVDQLKTYSDIIGLPLEIVYSPEELQKAIVKHQHKQLILIDTAGRSQHNEYQMKELCELLEVDPAIEKHLVMSATTKNRDAVDILDKFSSCKPERVLFTKTDETSSLGIILNVLFKKKIALSYLTNGQSVPDDIVPATADKLSELLLR